MLIFVRHYLIGTLIYVRCPSVKRDVNVQSNAETVFDRKLDLILDRHRQWDDHRTTGHSTTSFNNCLLIEILAVFVAKRLPLPSVQFS